MNFIYYKIGIKLFFLRDMETIMIFKFFIIKYCSNQILFIIKYLLATLLCSIRDMKIIMFIFYFLLLNMLKLNFIY